MAFSEPAVAGAVEEIVVRRWDGTSWVTVGDVLDAAPASAEQPSLAVDASDRPVVAWAEGSPRAVHVWRFEADRWIPLGEGMRGASGPFGVELPSLAVGAGGELVVAWHEPPDGASTPSIFVRRWDGAAWQPLGGPLDRLPGATRAIWADVAVAPSGEPHVAWVENDVTGRGEVYVARWDGGAWQPLGGPLSASTSGEGPALPALTFDGTGQPVVAFGDSDEPSGGEVHVRRWTGATWEDLGSPSVGLPGVVGAAEPSLLVDANGRLVISFSATGEARAIYVRRWTGSTWSSFGSVGAPTPDLGQPFLSDLTAAPCGDPIVVWQQAPSRGGTLEVFAAQWERASTAP